MAAFWNCWTWWSRGTPWADPRAAGDRGPAPGGVEFRSLSEDFDTATGKLQLTMVLTFSEWWRNSIRERSVVGQAKARAEGRFVSSTNCYIDNRRLKKQGCHRAW